MPLRVKCRCGQELVLRFNEWIYALFGLVILCLLACGTAMGIIVYKLSAIESYSREARQSTADRSPAPESEIAKAPDVPVPPPSPPETTNAVLTEAARDRSEAPKSAPSPLKDLRPEEKPAPAPESGTLRPAMERPAAGNGDSRPPANSPAGSKSREKSPEKSPQKARPVKIALQGVPPLERLLVVGRSDDPSLQLFFLEDQDPAVRRSAVARFLASPKPDAALSGELLALALPAAALLLTEPAGHELLLRLAGKDRGREVDAWWEWGRSALGTDPRQGPSEAVLRSLAGRAEAMRASFPAAVEMGKVLDDRARSAGTDLLLCIDSSESMEEPLKALAGEAWMFPALVWSIPGLRIGLLLYADEVTSTLPLGTDPGELARAVSGLKAEGGGDVPEGVHEALKAALQLGRFDWRPEARKQIIFLGDGPPPRVEVPGLLSLARECHGEAGYQIDALSVNPPEGQTATLHFPEMAAAGGGRAVTAAPDRIAAEVFLSLFPPGARQELNRLLPLIAKSQAP